jgi:hypothetical protein
LEVPVSCSSLAGGQAEGPGFEERGMLETTRASSSCDFVRGVWVAGSVAGGCREKEGSRSHDDQDEVGCCGGSGIGLVVAGRCGVAAVAADADCAARSRSCCACCSQSSRVLWSTGHFSSPPCAASDPCSFMLAVAVAGAPVSAVLLPPCAAASLRLTKTVSRRSVCIMRACLFRWLSVVPAGWRRVP